MKNEDFDISNQMVDEVLSVYPYLNLDNILCIYFSNDMAIASECLCIYHVANFSTEGIEVLQMDTLNTYGFENETIIYENENYKQRNLYRRGNQKLTSRIVYENEFVSKDLHIRTISDSSFKIDYTDNNFDLIDKL